MMKLNLGLLGALALAAGCVKTTEGTIPEIVSTLPADGATDVAVNTNVTATFSEPMDATTLTPSSFFLTTGDPAEMVPGTVVYADDVATFWPSSHLADDAVITATVTVDALSADGVALDTETAWSFTTGTTVMPGQGVNLGSAGSMVILAKSAISTVPTSAVTGDIGVSPAAASFITGFSLSIDATNAFATSTQVVGKIYAADYSPPTPSELTTKVGDMEIAFNDAAGRAPDVTELGAGDIGGMTIAPGVYKWSSGLLIPTDITLAGDATAVWIFQVSQDLIVSSSARVTLSGGAKPENVYWQVAGLVDLGTTSHMEGVILTQTSATLRTGASMNGRILAQTSVDLDGNIVVAP